jgi:ribosomal protein S18 acetylase RimI-like enzyme
LAERPAQRFWDTEVVADFHTVEENLRHAFRLFAASHAGGETREMAGVTIASSGVTFSMFNAAFLAAPVEAEQDMDRRIAVAGVHFGARGVSWSYWVCEGWLNGKVLRRAADLFARHQLYFTASLPGLVAERITPPARVLPPISVRRVEDEATWRAFCDIGSVCFNVPPAWFREVFQESGLWEGGFAGYVGYRNNEPVSTAATVTAAGAVGVYNVATLPGHQGCGYGEAIMRYALDRAREQHGIERTVLQSTREGLKLYRRMGYSEVTKVAVYST